jgi:hypothetical protein
VEFAGDFAMQTLGAFFLICFLVLIVGANLSNSPGFMSAWSSFWTVVWGVFLVFISVIGIIISSISLADQLKEYRPQDDSTPPSAGFGLAVSICVGLYGLFNIAPVLALVALCILALIGLVLYMRWDQRNSENQKAEVLRQLAAEEQKRALLDGVAQEAIACATMPSADQFAEDMLTEYRTLSDRRNARYLTKPYLLQIAQVFKEIFAKEFPRAPVPDPSVMARVVSKSRDIDGGYKLCVTTFAHALAHFAAALPIEATTEPRFFDSGPCNGLETSLLDRIARVTHQETIESDIPVDIYTLDPDAKAAFRALAQTFHNAREAFKEFGIFDWSEMGLDVYASEPNRYDIDDPREYELKRKVYEDAVQQARRIAQPWDWLLLDTPLCRYGGDLIPKPYIRVSVPLMDEERFTHHWIVAPSGTGKTTLLESMIINDLYRVGREEASVLVMDSQNELIERLASLKVFAPGRPLHDKLVILEPDPDYPLALNMFDTNMASARALSGAQREEMVTTIHELTQFTLTGLLGAEMTAKQSVPFAYLIQFLTAIPDATLATLRDLLQPDGLEQYRQHLDLLEDEQVRYFFEQQFSGKRDQYATTKQELLWRFDLMMKNATFRRMFSHPRNKLNLFEELNSAKVILVNTNRNLLKAEGCETFGRFFIAQLLQAATRRSTIAKAKRLPVFAYIDECQDYIKNEPKVAELLDKARKQKVGLILAHQRLANIASPDVLDALSNVGIRFAGGNDTDANALAKLLRTEPEKISTQPRGSFIGFIRGQTREGLELRVPGVLLDTLPIMSAAEKMRVKECMRERYCTAWTASQRVNGGTTVNAVSDQSTLPPPQNDREGSTRPTKGWH